MSAHEGAGGDFVVIGAGPAGLTAGYELAKLGFRPIVLEQQNLVGGLASTAQYRGYYFDMGGHRFFTAALVCRGYTTMGNFSFIHCAR